MSKRSPADSADADPPSLSASAIIPQVRKSRPTMTEVALAAGVSQTTVSLVLNNAAGARLSSETRQRVLEAAGRLGYRLIQRGAQDTGADVLGIGFVVDEMSTDPWMAIALDGVRDRAWEHGLTVSVASTRSDAEMEQAVLKQLHTQPLLGIIYGTINTRQVELRPEFLRKPTVLLNCYVSERSLPSVVPAEVVGGHTATERLVRAGHRRIGMINGEPWMDASHDRLKGYRQALATADLPFDQNLVRSGNWEPSAGYSETLFLMKLERPPTAIFCANDLMAIGCYEALREIGLYVPKDVAVVGYDDREIAQFMRPPLTTVLLPHFEMGVTAAQCLIDHARRPMSRPFQVKVEGPLVERHSV